jgi:hypothetical protein
MLPSAEFGLHLDGKNCATHSLHFSLIEPVTKAKDPADGFQSLRSQTYFIAGPLVPIRRLSRPEIGCHFFNQQMEERAWK